MSCFPPCNPWCLCVDNECQHSPVQINAVRLRTPDGRNLVAVNGGGAELRASTGGSEQSRTFLFTSPTTWPLSSGSSFALVVCDQNFAPSTNQIRVGHTVVLLNPPPQSTLEKIGSIIAIFFGFGGALEPATSLRPMK